MARFRQVVSVALLAWLAASGSASAVVEGERLFVRKGCISCHALKGLKEATGTMGPDLGKLFKAKPPKDPKAVTAQILDPKGVDPGATMPTLGLSAGEAAILANYLLTPRSPRSAASASAAPAAASR